MGCNKIWVHMGIFRRISTHDFFMDVLFINSKPIKETKRW